LALVTALTPKAFQLWPWLFGTAAILTLVTCLNRLARALAELRKP